MRAVLRQLEEVARNGDVFTVGFGVFENDVCIGDIRIQATRIPLNVQVTGVINGRQFMMNDADDVPSFGNGIFRQINVIENSQLSGKVYATEIKTGFFKRKSYVKCDIGSYGYELYNHDINGRKLATLFYGNEQISQYEHTHKGLHDLHRFDICCVDQNALYVSLLAALRFYIVVYLKPKHNELCQYRVIHSISANEWLDKYDANWTNRF